MFQKRSLIGLLALAGLALLAACKTKTVEVTREVVVTEVHPIPVYERVEITSTSYPTQFVVVTATPEPTDLSSIIQGVRAEFELALQARCLTLTLENLDSLPLTQVDPYLMYKVFYHLIVDAIKYTPDGGAITVSGATVSDEPDGSSVEALVRDTGIGIDPAHHELIFEKLYQTGKVDVHSSGRTKFKGGGPGLGLAIARGVVLAHGGKIWVESPGHDEETCPGSQFHVWLPLEERG